MNFRSFLLNENHHYLGKKMGDILGAVQSLSDDATQMGSRSIIKAAEGIVNQIRRILHGRWADDDLQYLKRLQKVGVAIMRGIDSDENMAQIMAAVSEEIQKVLDDLEVPINDLGSEEETEEETEEDEDVPISQGSQLGA
jgi:hypothetical protein